MSPRIRGLHTTTAAAWGAHPAGHAAAGAAAPPPAPDPAPPAVAQPPAAEQPAADQPAADEPSDAAPPSEAEEPSQAAPPAAEQPSEAAPPESKPSTKDTKDTKDGKHAKELKECADADCEVKVRDGQVIKLDKKYGMAPIRIRVDENRITLSSRGQGTVMSSSMNASRSNSSVTYNGITFSPRLNRDGSITMKVSHE
ncbi:hypothetical protein AB0K34_44415 [Actinomadura sp. NPDC049382]|uniref:hypothetical protein n=1 Tax=Actinomadura sp. NPDC049382 TaxID=3158220 RepID=UPI0034152027